MFIIMSPVYATDFHLIDDKFYFSVLDIPKNSEQIQLMLDASTSGILFDDVFSLKVDDGNGRPILRVLVDKCHIMEVSAYWDIEKGCNGYTFTCFLSRRGLIIRRWDGGT
jgi:hypothetical protein